MRLLLRLIKILCQFLKLFLGHPETILSVNFIINRLCFHFIGKFYIFRQKDQIPIVPLLVFVRRSAHHFKMYKEYPISVFIETNHPMSCPSAGPYPFPCSHQIDRAGYIFLPQKNLILFLVILKYIKISIGIFDTQFRILVTVDIEKIIAVPLYIKFFQFHRCPKLFHGMKVIKISFFSCFPDFCGRFSAD